MKLAIVARAPSSRYVAPFSSDDWQIWTLSPMGAPDFCDLPRFDRWYEIHQLEEKNVECPGYIDWLKTHGDKVWLREPHQALPEASIFPIADIKRQFQLHFVNPFNYYTNSVSLMMAHAIVESPDTLEELMLAGVDMCQITEYGKQKPSCEFFIGYLAGRGVAMNIPTTCDMLKANRVYGIEDLNAWDIKSQVHAKELDARLNQMQRDLNESQKQLVGAAAAHGELKDIYGALNGSPDVQPIKELIGDRLKKLEDIGSQYREAVSELDGNIRTTIGAQEALNYMQTYVP
jgi:hypothetical protein